MKQWLHASSALPEDRDRAQLVGRAWLSDGGPAVCVRRVTYDLSTVAPTSSELLNMQDPLAAIRGAGTSPWIGSLEEILINSAPEARNGRIPRLLAPCDLQAVKASGVTFVASLLERVIEEQARGDAARRRGLRQSILAVIGSTLYDIR